METSITKPLSDSSGGIDLIAALTMAMDLIGCPQSAVPTGIKRDILLSFCSEHFTPLEVIEAFKTAVSGKIQVELNLYGSAFNALYVSNVVKAYRAHVKEKLKKEQKLLGPSEEEALTLRERGQAIFDLIRGRNPETLEKIFNKANEIERKNKRKL